MSSYGLGWPPGPRPDASGPDAVPCARCGHRADRLRRIQPPGQHERRQQRVAHPARRAPQPRHEDLPAAAPRPDMPPVARPVHQRLAARQAIRARELHLLASSNVRIDRQRARPYDGHGRHPPWIPPRDRANRRRGGILTSNRNGTILARPKPPGNIAKERGRRPARDTQIVRPSTGVCDLHNCRSASGPAYPLVTVGYH